MSEESEIEIIQYSPDIAAGVAEMFNKWDDLWPGGFTSGVPYTEERVRKIYDKMRALAILIAVDQDSNQLVGFCSLMQHWKDAAAAYIGLLGASPEVLNKKVGKRLLLKAMSIAIDKGYQRVDLHTWSGNLRAVPLYKKMGLMWNPVMDGVHLEGFVPEILAHPMTSPFFAKNTEVNAWYSLQEREIEQAPDEIDDQGMEVYKYSFKDDDNSLIVTVDRLCKAIVGFERTMGGETLGIHARVKKHLTICGVPSKYTLVIENKTSKPVSLSAVLEGFKGIDFNDNSKTKLTVAPFESAQWTVPYVVDSTAKLHDKEEKTPAIITKLDVDGVKSELRTGLKIRSAAEVRTRWGQCIVHPGGRTSLPITVVGHTLASLKGRLNIETPQVPMKVGPKDPEIEISAEGIGGVVLDVVAEKTLDTGTHDLQLSFTFKTMNGNGEEVEITTRKFRVPVFCLEDGTVAIGEDDRLKRVLVVSPKYTVQLSREGAYARVTDMNTYTTVRLAGEIGPPFGLSPFRGAERDVDIQQDALQTTISLSAKHPEKTLIIEDRMIFRHDSDIITHELWVTNNGKEPQTIQQRMYGGGGGLSLSSGFADAIIPFKSGLVRSSGANTLLSYPGIPSDPDSFGEQWVCMESPNGTIGQIWSPENVEEVRLAGGQINRISYDSITVDPGESVCTSRVWNVVGVATWKNIQRLWKSLVKKESTPITKLWKKVDELRPLGLKTESVVVPSIQKGETSITFVKFISPPLPGALIVEAPEGWTAQVKDPSGSPMSEDSPVSVAPEVAAEDGLSLSVELTPTDSVKKGFSISEGVAKFSTLWDFESRFSLVQLGDTSAELKVEEIEEEGLKVFRVTNREIEFKVSADYGGCLYSLKNNRSVELLSSAFPNPAPKEFFDNYYGGIQPLIWDDEMDEDIIKAKTNQEKMKAKVIEIGDCWKGIEVSWTSKVQQMCKGAKSRVRYMTAPGSPLVVLDFEISNDTSAPLRFFPMLLADTAIDGDLSEAILKSRISDGLVTARPGPVPTILLPTTNFSWLSKGDDGIAYMVAGTELKSLTFHLASISISSALDFWMWLQPGQKYSLRAALFINPPNEEVIEKVQAVLEELT
ncbi:MAG: GNAT family N-acetyltransferase [Candidatus Thorarchaeota archaeon]|jgi:GNAT superfamily N-acetyltransferase